MSRHNPIFTFNAELDRFLNSHPSYTPYPSVNPMSKPKPIPSKWKSAPIKKPVVPEPIVHPIDVEDSDSEDSEPGDDNESQAMEDEDRFPTMALPKPKQSARGRDQGRPAIFYERVITDAPLSLNGLMYNKAYDSFSFAISKADAEMCNIAIVEELGCDPATPLIKWSDDFNCYIMRGKPQGNLKINYDNVEAKRSYTIKFNIGKWANPSEGTSGVSASVIDLLDSKGTSLAKLDIKFPTGTSFTAGRRLSKEEIAERKRNQ